MTEPGPRQSWSRSPKNSGSTPTAAAVTPLHRKIDFLEDFWLLDVMPGPKPRPIPSKEELEAVYPSSTLKAAAEHFGIGQTLFFKWLKARDIPRARTHRKPRSDEHKKHLSEAHKTRPKKELELNRVCPACGKEFHLKLVEIKEQNYCSNKCRGIAKRNPLTKKTCVNCGSEFARRKSETSGNFSKRKLCSKECQTAFAPPPVGSGADNPRWKGDDARRRNRLGPSRKWREQVLARDDAACQRCGATDATLVAHHILPFETYPEKRWDVDNGLTLCQLCHFKEHGWALSDEGVHEFTDERGVLLRRWTGSCLNCGKFLVKRASDLRRADGSTRDYAFCSKNCSLELAWKLRAGKSPSSNYSDLFETYANTQKMKHNS